MARIEKTGTRTSAPAGTIPVLDGVTGVNGFEIQAVGRFLPAWDGWT